MMRRDFTNASSGNACDFDGGHGIPLHMPSSEVVPGAQVISRPFVASDVTIARALRRAVDRRLAAAISNPHQAAPDLVDVLLEELRT